MNGYVDLHCHLLPGADDGVQNVEEALQCLRAAQEAGFSEIALTRHLKTGFFDFPKADADSRRSELQNAAGEAGLSIRLHGGGEHYLDDTFLAALETGVETIAGGKGLLMELPMMLIPPFISEVAFRIRLKGMAPILAHLERCAEIVEEPKKARSLAEMGYLLQVNLGSLGGFYGRRVAKAARTIVGNGWTFCAASDCHGPMMIESVYREGIKELRKFGDEAVRMLLSDNPRKILRGEMP